MDLPKLLSENKQHTSPSYHSVSQSASGFGLSAASLIVLLAVFTVNIPIRSDISAASWSAFCNSAPIA